MPLYNPIDSMADTKIIRKFSADTKELTDTRSFIVTISTDTPDRDGDVVVPKGAKLDNYLKNPVVLFGHKYNEPAIAKASEIIVDDHSIKAKVTFPSKGVYPFADTIYDLIKDGFMNAWSIGFSAVKDATERLESGGLRFNEWEMLEFSAVPVPANQEALTILRSKGFSDVVIKELAEEAPVAPERLPEEEKTIDIPAIEAKDVAQVLSLAYVLDELNWVIYMFEQNEVSEDTITKLKEALAIILAVVKDQAKLGKKEFTIEPGTQAPALPELPDMTASEDLAKTLTALRDQLKPADKEIGLVLRTLKSLLDKPTQ